MGSPIKEQYEMGEHRFKLAKSPSICNIPKKIISLLVVLFLIFTAFSSVVPAQDTYSSSTVQPDSEPATKILLRDIFQELSILRKSGTPIFSVVTKYNDTETTTRLKRFLPTAIDVNGDGKKDIRVWLFRLPGIDLRPPAACIKTTLFIRRLNDDIKYGPFEIYLQYAPKIVSKLIGGKLDRFRVGYQSPAGGEIPDRCKIVYTYVPHAIYPRLKPVHKVYIDPGTIAGKSNLNLLFSIADTDEGNVSSENIWSINYNPAVKTEFSVGRLRKGLGFDVGLSTSGESKTVISYTKEQEGNSVDVGLLVDKLSSFNFQLHLSLSSRKESIIEYERTSSNPVNVTLFKKNSDNFYFYVKSLPKHMKMSFIPESNGWMEINTYGEYVNEAGFCDDLVDPSWELYFADLPATAKLDWDLLQKKSLEVGSLNVSGDEECSVHLYASLNNILNTGSNAKVKLDVYALSDIYFSTSWNFKDRYIRLDQSKTDLDLSLSVISENGNAFAGSCRLANLYDEPFTLFFDDLSDEKADLTLIGQSFDVYNLNANISLQNLGNFTVNMGHLKKDKSGNLNISLFVTKNGSYVNCNCTFVVTGGIEVYDFKIGYNGLWYNSSYIVVDESDTLYFHFGGSFDILYDIGSDLSWGYINIRGSIYVDVDFSFNSNGTHGLIKGKIQFKSNGEWFNISWITVDDKKRFTIDGTGLVGLSDFRFWFGDIIDISIDELAGSILLGNASRDQGSFLFEFQGSGSLYLDGSFSSKNESDVKCNITLDAQVDTNGVPATIAVSWKDGNATMSKFNIGEGAYLDINDLDLEVTKDGNKSLDIENLVAHLSGYLHVFFNRSINDSFICMKNTDAFLHVDDYNNSGSGFDLGEVNISADCTGSANISFYNFTKQISILPYYEVDVSWFNVTVILDASQGALNLNELYIEHLAMMNYSSAVSIKNVSISGYSKADLTLSINETEIAPRNINICLNNNADTTILLDKSSFDLFLFEIPPIPITIYSGKLVQGTFDMHLRTYEIIAFEIVNGSAIDHLDLDIIPIRNITDFHLAVFFDESVDYLLFDWNRGINEGNLDYFLIDTHNKTEEVNLSFTMPGETQSDRNIMGFRFDNVTIQADMFYLYLPNLFYDPQNFTVDQATIQGYLHVEGEGKIWMLKNGNWYPIDIFGHGGYLAINPSHLTLKLDGEITLDHTLPIGNGSEVKIAGTFVAENCNLEMWWNRSYNWAKIELNGNLAAENFLFDVEYNNNGDSRSLEISWDHFSLSLSQKALIYVKTSYLKVNVTSGYLQIDNLNVFTSNSQRAFSLAWSTFNSSGQSYLVAGLEIEPSFFINGAVDHINIVDLNVNNENKTIQIDLIDLSGEFNFSTLPEQTDLIGYLGIDLSLNGTFEIDGISSNNPDTSKLDRIYFDGAGDMKLENWQDEQSNITTSWESQNGFIGQSASIQLDTGRVFEIANLASGNANVGSGYLILSWNIDGDSNGMVFLDSSSIVMDNARISYWKPRHFGWGIRLGITDNFYADEWRLKWFPIRKTGHIYIGGVDIDITNGEDWFNIWPLFHPDEMTGESAVMPSYNGHLALKYNSMFLIMHNKAVGNT